MSTSSNDPALRLMSRPLGLPRPKTAATATPRKEVRISSDSLFGESREIFIEHGTEAYRLRKTRLGKLILTK